MKYYYSILIFLLSFSFYAQNDSITAIKNSNISVVSADKMNVVYRGVPNPISVMVPSDKYFSAIAPGLENKGNGKFILKPGAGKEVEILVSFKNEERKPVVEKHVFRIKGLPAMVGTINGNNCLKCSIGLTKKEMENAEISTEMKDFLFIDLDSEFYLVKNFDVKFSEDNIVSVEGNKITNKVMIKINKLKKGDIFEINITNYGFDCDTCEKRRIFQLKLCLQIKYFPE